MMDPTPAGTDRATGSRASGRAAAGPVLLVEDDPVSQRVAVVMLESLAFDVDVVSDGVAAVDAAIRTPYRAILMDCQIPVMDGFQATAEIRRRQSVSRRTPIIAITASATTTDHQRCLAAGMDACLAKPLSLKSLAAVLARWATVASVTAIGDDPVAFVPATDVVPARSGDLSRPALDVLVVARLERMGKVAGEDVVGQLATLFLTDAGDRVLALRQALVADDAAGVVATAHALGGASANLGANDLASLCATLATDGATGDLVGGGALLEAVEAELGRVRAALGALTPMS